MASKRNFKAIAILLVILPFAILFPLGYYLERGLPYTDDDYCDLCNAPSEWIITRTDNGVTYPVHEFCERDAYICFFSVTLLRDLGFLHTNLTIPDYELTQTHFYQASVFIIYYCSVALYLLTTRRKIQRLKYIPAYARAKDTIPHRMKLKDAFLNAFEMEGDILTQEQIIAYINKHRHEIEDLKTLEYSVGFEQALREIIDDLTKTGEIRKESKGIFPALNKYCRIRPEGASHELPLPPPPEEVGYGGGIWKVIYAVIVVVLIFGITILPIIPVTYEGGLYYEQLIDRISSVPAGKIMEIGVYIDVDHYPFHEDAYVAGNVTENSGRDIMFYILDEWNYNRWKEGYPMHQWASRSNNSFAPETITLVFNESRQVMSNDRYTIHSAYYYFLAWSGNYYFILDNTYSNYTKTVHLTSRLEALGYVFIITRYESLVQILLSWWEKCLTE